MHKRGAQRDNCMYVWNHVPRLSRLPTAVLGLELKKSNAGNASEERGAQPAEQ